MKKIICFHLYNDYSGSPKVLKMLLEGLLYKGYKVELITSRGGILSELKHSFNLNLKSYPYDYSKKTYFTLLKYFIIQVITFIYSFKYLFHKEIIFYINTILPVGPAIAAYLMQKKIVYHYHENAFEKSLFYTILAKIMQYLASDIICVSKYQRDFLHRQNNIVIIPNSVPLFFADKFKNMKHKEVNVSGNILMLSSLKTYKGIIEFIKLSVLLPQYNFCLVINDSIANIESFITNNNISINSNITIYSRQSNIIPFYEKANIVLNLTNPQYFVETFGLTALESMTAGVPVIVPTVGGIAELVIDGFNGYKISVDNLSNIAKRIDDILSNKSLYIKLSSNARNTALNFDYNHMLSRIEDIL